MALGVLPKKNLKKLITAILKDGTLYGPVNDGNGVTLSEIQPDNEISFDYMNFTLSPKMQFFPQCETLCSYNKADVTETPLPEGMTVIFGIRPCDTMSQGYLDKIFLDEQCVDPYYRSRRDNTILISLACREPVSSCFCTSTGGHPAGKEGTDILAFDLDDALLFETVSERGDDFLKKHASLFEEPSKEYITAKDTQASDAEKKIAAVDISGITENLVEKFDSPIWDKIAQSCLGCGVCTFLCPTCHCFGIHDEKKHLNARRIRTHDACMFSSFTHEASGHNPRVKQGDRMRQRVMHKFRYTVENLGDIFCVGCGRCVTNCPVNIDIRESLAEVKK